MGLIKAAAGALGGTLFVSSAAQRNLSLYRRAHGSASAAQLQQASSVPSAATCLMKTTRDKFYGEV